MGRKTEVLLSLFLRDRSPPIRRALVVGCGRGNDAAAIAASLGCAVVGVDISSDFGDFSHLPVEFHTMDAQRLEFPDETFDLVYSFHALEHISWPAKALTEMSRVLARNGAYCVGTPNKDRILGYVGVEEPIVARIRMNLQDWGKRARGQWDNSKGAHAGFSSGELMALCGEAFGSAVDLSASYYSGVYPRFEPVLEAVARTRAARLIWPSIYVAGTKKRLCAVP